MITYIKLMENEESSILALIKKAAPVPETAFISLKNL